LSADHEVLCKSCKADFSGGFDNQGSGIALRKIEVGIKDKDYLDFLSVCIEDNLSVEVKLKDIIRYHIITYRNRKKMWNQKLF
jgi:hypothetical protein